MGSPRLTTGPLIALNFFFGRHEKKVWKLSIMRWFIILAMALAAVQGKPDKPLLRRGQQGRQNRQLDTGYGAPDTGYGAPLEEEVLDVRAGEELATYAEEPLDTYSDLNAEASDDENDPLAMLMKSVPGTPGEDYPIFSEAPETAFSCEGQVNGGYYADPEAECQVFHICSDDGAGGLAKYSFLCPNGTIFNQNYFICDWWFNVDCSEAEALAEAKNSELQSEREAAEARLAELAAEESAPAGYGAPAEYGVPATEAPVAIEAKEGYGAPDDYEAAASDDDYAVYEYDQAPIVEARQSQYEARRSLR